jgi:hypothetical protein
MTRNVDARKSVANVVYRVTILSCLAVMAPQGVEAQETGNVTRNLLSSFGLVDPDKPQIEYRDRAPLVIPPSTNNLRTPTDSDERLERNASFPKDSDMLKRRQADREKDIPNHIKAEQRNPHNPLLSVDEIRSGRRPGYTGQGSDNYIDRFQGPHVRLTPEEMKGPKVETSNQNTANPTREWLTDPPSKYREPVTPSAASLSAPQKEEKGFLSKLNPFN